MIARGRKAPLAHASAFHRRLLATGVQDDRACPGCLEVRLLGREGGKWARFLLFSVWGDLGAIRLFAGDGPERTIALELTP